MQVRSDPIDRVVTASAGIQTHLLKVDQFSCRPICHSSDPQAFTVCVSIPRPTCLGDRCSQHKFVGCLCLCLPSYGSPSQGDPTNLAMQLPHHSNSPRLARDALVLGPSAALNGDPTPTTSINNTSQTVSQPSV